MENKFRKKMDLARGGERQRSKIATEINVVLNLSPTSRAAWRGLLEPQAHAWGYTLPPSSMAQLGIYFAKNISNNQRSKVQARLIIYPADV
jgi:hypothetical protein